MSVTLKWDGLEAFKAELDKLPEDLTTDADPIVHTAADSAAEDIKAAYPVRTGNLRNHVYVSQRDKGKDTSVWMVKNTAKHAFIFENGTQARHTSIGANRGAMPPGHVFIPAVIKRRRQMYQRLKDLLARKGLVVTGDA